MLDISGLSLTNNTAPCTFAELASQLEGYSEAGLCTAETVDETVRYIIAREFAFLHQPIAIPDKLSLPTRGPEDHDEPNITDKYLNVAICNTEPPRPSVRTEHLQHEPISTNGTIGQLLKTSKLPETKNCKKQMTAFPPMIDSVNRHNHCAIRTRTPAEGQERCSVYGFVYLNPQSTHESEKGFMLRFRLSVHRVVKYLTCCVRIKQQ